VRCARLRFGRPRIVLARAYSIDAKLSNKQPGKKYMTGQPPPTRTPPRALRLHGTIARKLGIAIVSGQYQPGDLLDSEIAASVQFAVSRTAYREAVRILAAKGLVDARPKVGTRINPRSKWNLLDPDVLEWTFESEPDLALLNSLFELRNVVESARGGTGGHAQIGASPQGHAGGPGWLWPNTPWQTPEGRQADLDFHTTLLSATDNPFIISLTSGVSAAISTTTIFKQRKRPLRRDPLPDHLRVFTAIAAKDAAKAQKSDERAHRAGAGRHASSAAFWPPPGGVGG